MSTLTADDIQDLLRANGVSQPIPQVPDLDYRSNLVNVYIAFLVQAVVDATGCDVPVALKAIQWPNDPGMGDLVLVTPRLRLGDISNEDIIERVGERTTELLALFGCPMADGIHQRIFLNGAVLGRLLLPFILDRGSFYGINSHDHDSQRKRGKVVVEFSSPNLGKEFDGNHLRSTIHGNFIAYLYEHLGYDVHRMNYLGDWGKHIGVLAEGWLRFGSETAFEATPLAHLLMCFKQADELLKAEQLSAKLAESHVSLEQGSVASPDSSCQSEIGTSSETASNGSAVQNISISDAKDAFFKRLEDGDQEAVDLWKCFRTASISSYQDLYRRMNVRFDEYGGESGVSHDTIAEVEAVLTEKGVYTESEEAWIIDFKKLGFKHLGVGITRYRNGTTSYLLRDIAAVLERSRQHSFDKMVYVVASRQETHFLQIFKALELMDMAELATKLQHVGFGKTAGLKPKGDSAGLLLEDMLSDARDAIDGLFASDSSGVEDFSSSEAGLLGALALACQDLAGKRSASFTYDPESMASTAGWTGLTLHMWLRRLTSLTNGKAIDRDLLTHGDTCYDLFDEAEYQEPLRLLLEFPHALLVATKTLESWGFVTYLYRLTDSLPNVIGDTEAEAVRETPVRLALLECVRQVLSTGMRVLGLGHAPATK